MKHKDHSVSDEWKTRKNDDIKFKDIRYRRKKVGEIRRHAPDKIIFWSTRTPDQVHYKLDAWGVSDQTLELLRLTRVKYIAIKVTNGDLYVGRVADFQNKDKGAVREERQNKVGATVTWFLPRSCFASRRYKHGGLALMMLPERA